MSDDYVTLFKTGPSLVYVSEGSEPTVTYLDHPNGPADMSKRDRAIAGALVALAQEHLDRADMDDAMGVRSLRGEPAA